MTGFRKVAVVLVESKFNAIVKERKQHRHIKLPPSFAHVSGMQSKRSSDGGFKLEQPNFYFMTFTCCYFMNFVKAISKIATENICKSDQAVSSDTARVSRFCLENKPHPDRPHQVNIQLLKQLIEYDPRQIWGGLAVELGCFHTAIGKHLN